MVTRRLPVDAALVESYEHCRELHRQRRDAFWTAGFLLPAWKRPHIHALFGFVRYTEQIVADTEGWPPPAHAARMRHWIHYVTDALATGAADDPVLSGLLHTIQTFNLDPAYCTAFVRSMQIDLSAGMYRDYDELRQYLDGAGAAIGALMLPIVGAESTQATGPTEASAPARDLGIGFRLARLITDLDRDLDRGRIYVPGADLAAHGVCADDLQRRVATPPIRALVAAQVDRARSHLAAGVAVITGLEPRSRAYLRAACGIALGRLTELERSGYDAFGRRRTARRWALAATGVLRPYQLIGNP
jgi:phytoene synthase